MKIVLKTVFAALVALLVPTQSIAASSQWYELDGARLRLVTSPRHSPQAPNVALEVELKKGWKTYWRSPGNNGIPPQLSWHGSVNILASPAISFPAPQKIGEGEAQVIGYKDRVVFPINIKPEASGEKSTLKLSVLMGICEEICVPVSASLEVEDTLSAARSSVELPIIMEGEAALPKPADSETHIVGVLSKSDPNKLHILANVPKSAAEVQLYAEGPKGWYLAPAKIIGGMGKEVLFALDISDRPKDADVEATKFHFTLVADDHAIEQAQSVKDTQN